MTEPPTDLPSCEEARKRISATRDRAAISALAGEWRATADMAALLPLAQALWTGGSDADMIVAAKLLTKARIDDDADVWTTLCEWVEAHASKAIAPALFAAGERRLSAKPSRLDEIARWATSEDPFIRAAFLGFAHGLVKDRHVSVEAAECRAEVTEWAVRLSNDPPPLPRKAAADTLLTLAKHDPDRIAQLIEGKAALPNDLVKRLRRAAGL